MEQRRQPGKFVPWIVVATLVAVIAATMLYQRGRGGDAAVAGAPGAPNPVATAPMRDGRPLPQRSVAQPMTPEMVRERQAVLAKKRAEVQQRVDQTQAAFRARYAGEPVDAAWAGAKEAALAQASVSPQIRELGVEPGNLAVDCRSTMCRITADFPSTSAGDDWFTLYMNNVATDVPVASYKYNRKPDGTYTIDVYAVGK
jgi:hypothetical protein